MEIDLADDPPSPGVFEETSHTVAEMVDVPSETDVVDAGVNKTEEDETEKADGERVKESVKENDRTINESSLDNFKTDVEIADIDPEVVKKLTKGFLNAFLPEGEKAKVTLDELLQNQKVLIETVQHERSKFTECTAFTDLTEMMNQARQYYNKLVTVKKDMAALHEKSVKLKKRALRLQQGKQKEMLQREQKHEKELEKERALMARPIKRSSSQPQERGGLV
ncbi:biogenesis of lysosome-related organelles complex 1 subunit 6-like [Lineus longissimus]|uniref:biogenesis of lysosome-related organelles complex 1 subunit 6-like n=1 Tax=Lineus longissimus TaxID=88925 RepID=UPI002B4F41D8